MVLGLDPDSPELSSGNLIDLRGDELPAVVFSDDPITKMHNSLPRVLFRFEILVKPSEARELDWVAYFFPWLLLNDRTSHEQVDTYDRVGWFQMASFFLMKIMVTSESRPVRPRVKLFGRKAAGPKERRLMSYSKLLIHTTNTIAEIACEIKLARTPISLQRISTVPVEQKFGETRIHADVHQTVVELVKRMKPCNLFMSKTRSKTGDLHRAKQSCPAHI
jgi:hypothetical protein